MTMVKFDRFSRAAILLRTKFSIYKRSDSKPSVESHSMDRIEPSLTHTDLPKSTSKSELKSQSIQPLSPLAQTPNLSAMTTRNARRAPVLDTSRRTEAL